MKVKRSMRALGLLIVTAFVGAIFVPVVSADDKELNEDLFIDLEH